MCLDVYGEYAPYTFVDDQDLLNTCISGEYSAEYLPLYKYDPPNLEGRSTMK